MNSRTDPDLISFFRAALLNPLEIGAIAPSSRLLAKSIASLIDPDDSGSIIELGSGTGVITDALIERGISSKRLILIEIDKSFLAKLTNRFPDAFCISESAYRLDVIRERYHIEPAAVIVSCLPLLLRSLLERQQFMGAVTRALKPGGTLVQFSYGIRAPIPGSRSLVIYSNPKRIWLNIPPATIWVYRKSLNEP